MRRLAVPFCLGVLSLSVACGDSGETGGGGEGAGPSSGGSPGTGGEGGGADPCITSTLDLDGSWVIRLTFPADIEGGPAGAFQACPAQQTGDVTMLIGMRVVSLASNHSATFAICDIDLPEFTASIEPCVAGSPELEAVDIRHYGEEQIHERSTDPLTMELASEELGATFTLPSFTLEYGAGQPLPSWNITLPACDDVTLGHGGCEPDCVTGCEEIDTENDDRNGFSWAVCGVVEGEVLGDCEPDEPTLVEGVTIQGLLYTAMEIATALEGSFATSCEGTGTITTDFAMSVIGGDVYVADAQQTVTDIANAVPVISFGGSGGTVELIRVDGKYGTIDLEEGDLDDTCDNIAENAAMLP